MQRKKTRVALDDDKAGLFVKNTRGKRQQDTSSLEVSFETLCSFDYLNCRTPTVKLFQIDLMIFCSTISVSILVSLDLHQVFIERFDEERIISASWWSMILFFGRAGLGWF